MNFYSTPISFHSFSHGKQAGIADDEKYSEKEFSVPDHASNLKASIFTEVLTVILPKSSKETASEYNPFSHWHLSLYIQSFKQLS